MNKQEFLLKLRKRLSGLPQDEVEERLTFYTEMIEDRMEEGLSEEEAVAAAGTIDDIVAQTVAEVPLVKIAKERIKPNRRIGVLEIVLLVLGSPIWLSLGVAAVAVVLSVYISLWCIIISLWSVFASFIGCAFGAFVAGIVFACNANVLTGIAMIGAGLVCVGFSIFMFYGCKAITKAILVLTKKFAVWIKKRCMKKEEA